MEPFFEAQDRQADACLHADPFAGRKNMEHEVRNVRSAKSGRGSLPDHKTGKRMRSAPSQDVHSLCPVMEEREEKV